MLKFAPVVFNDTKIWLVDATGLTRDALHIYVALALFIAARILLRGRFAVVAALLVVLLGALTGEWLDHRVELLRHLPCDRGEHWHDIWNTLFWPVALTIALPWLRRAAERDASDAATLASGQRAERRLKEA